MKIRKKAFYYASISIIVLIAMISFSFVGSNGNAAAISNQPNSSSGPAISAVLTGTVSTSSITLGPNPNPIGSNVSIDVRIDNVSAGFYGWSIMNVNWDPTVLNLTQVQKGPFLSDNTGGDPTLFNGNSNKVWYYWSGLISGGLSEGIVGPDTSIDASGVLATLTFNVTGLGSSTIGLEGGNMRLTHDDLTGVNVPCNNATITVLSNNPSSTPTASPSLSPTPTPIPTSAPTNTPSPTPVDTSATNPSPTSTPSSRPITTTPTITPTPSLPEYPLWIIISMLSISILASLAYLRKKRPDKSQLT